MAKKVFLVAGARPVTVKIGSNVIAGTDTQKIIDYAGMALQGKWKDSVIPELWDGVASERIVCVIMKRDCSGDIIGY